MTTTLDDLVRLEHEGWESLCASTGADFYGAIMTDDAVMVLAHGQVLDRPAVISSLDEAPPWRSYDIADERVIALGDDAAALVYTGRAYRDDDDPAFVALMTSVYLRTPAGWRLAVYQQTPVPPAE